MAPPGDAARRGLREAGPATAPAGAPGSAMPGAAMADEAAVVPDATEPALAPASPGSAWGRWLARVRPWLLGAVFLAEAYALRSRVRHGGREPQAMRLFHGSISYLSLLFLAVAIDPFLG